MNISKNTYSKLDYRFNGKELDPETGNYYYGARYYDPKISVWLSVDPLAHKMPNWSPYSFSFNNPIKFVDPDGRIPIPLILGAIGAAYEYSSQVYSNYQSGYSGSDAWYGNVDFLDVLVEGVATGTGTKFAGDVAVEGVKASLDIKGSGQISYVGDGSSEKEFSNVLKTTAENSVLSLAGSAAGKKTQGAFNNNSVKNANSDIVGASKNLRKANNISGFNSTSPSVIRRQKELNAAKTMQEFKSIGNDLGLGSDAGKVIVEKISSEQVGQIREFLKDLE